MEWDAEKNQKFSQMQIDIGNHAIANLNPQPGELILDIGCGIGNLTEKIAIEIGDGKVIGIDNDATMIQTCIKRRKTLNSANMEFIRQSAVDLDFTNQFDAVFSNIVLHWIRDVSRVFLKIYQALKPNGRLSIGTLYTEPTIKLEVTREEDIPNKQQISLSDIEMRYMASFIEKGHYKDILTLEEFLAYQTQVDKNVVYHTHTIEEFKEMLEKARFTDIVFEKRILTNYYDNCGHYLDYRQSSIWVYFLSFFPKEYRIAVANKLKALIENEWNQMPERKKLLPITEPWPVLFIQARK